MTFTKKRKALAITALLLLAAGGTIWAVIASKSSKNGNDDYQDEDDKKNDSTPAPKIPTYTPAKPVSVPFKNTTDGNKFRAWVNDKHSDWAKANSLDRTGSYNNSYVQSAWKVFGQEYQDAQKSTSSAPSPTTTTPAPTTSGELKSGDKLYLTDEGAAVYSYPQSSATYIKGTVKRFWLLDSPAATFIEKAGNTGFYKVSLPKYMDNDNDPVKPGTGKEDFIMYIQASKLRKNQY